MLTLDLTASVIDRPGVVAGGAVDALDGWVLGSEWAGCCVVHVLIIQGWLRMATFNFRFPDIFRNLFSGWPVVVHSTGFCNVVKRFIRKSRKPLLS